MTVEIVLTYLGAVISGVAALVAWLANYNMKRYEIEQRHIAKMMEKRFEAYPPLWFVLGDFILRIEKEKKIYENPDADKKPEAEKYKQLVEQLLSQVKEHEAKDGIFYSKQINSELENMKKHISHILEDCDILGIATRNLANSMEKVRWLMKDDIGGLGELAGKRINNA